MSFSDVNSLPHTVSENICFLTLQCVSAQVHKKHWTITSLAVK